MDNIENNTNETDQHHNFINGETSKDNIFQSQISMYINESQQLYNSILYTIKQYKLSIDNNNSNNNNNNKNNKFGILIILNCKYIEYNKISNQLLNTQLIINLLKQFNNIKVLLYDINQNINQDYILSINKFKQLQTIINDINDP